jgi:hypothetical protein
MGLLRSFDAYARTTGTAAVTDRSSGRRDCRDDRRVDPAVAALVVADQRASTLTALRVDRESGRAAVAGSVPLPAPACVAPVRTG